MSSSSPNQKPQSGNNEVQYKKYNKWQTQARFQRAGANSSRSLDKLVEAEKEKIKRHNRLVDLKLEVEAKRRKEEYWKNRRRDDLPTVPSAAPRFGKESVQDDAYTELLKQAREAEKQTKKRKVPQVTRTKKETTLDEAETNENKEDLLDRAERRHQKVTEEIDDSDTSESSSEEEEEPPKKLSKRTEEETKTDSKSKAGRPSKGDPFAEARAKFEETKKAQQEKREAFAKHKEEVAKKQDQQRKVTRKLNRRTPKGQPIMKNMLNHFINKIEK